MLFPVIMCIILGIFASTLFVSILIWERWHPKFLKKLYHDKLNWHIIDFDKAYIKNYKLYSKCKICGKEIDVDEAIHR